MDPFAANQAMWDETASVHEEACLGALLEAVAKEDFCTFDAVERRVFDELGFVGKSIAQPCCNNARELLSLKKAGAGRCVGFDFSSAFLEQGRRLSEAAKVELELVKVNVTEIPDEYSGEFDIVYVSVGVLGWLPKVESFFASAAKLLRPGGHLFVYEMHPFLFLFDEESTCPDDPRISRGYFREEPICFENSADYFDPSRVIKSPSYWYQHTMGEVVSAVLRAGLTLAEFQEYPHDISASYSTFEGQEHSIPMCYSLVGGKRLFPAGNERQ